MATRALIAFLLALFLIAQTHRSAGSLGKARDHTEGAELSITFFWGVGCPHCARAKLFLNDLQKRYPGLSMREIEVMEHRENIPQLLEMARRAGKEATGVPTFFINDRMFSGFSAEVAQQLENEVQRRIGAERAGEKKAVAGPNAFELPFVGTIDLDAFSLPVLTIVIAGLDSFNPCAFFVLLFLLSLLIHAHSRLRMVLIGGVFVLCSGIIYFLFMAVWLNLFMLVGHLSAITTGAGIVALIIALINIKDFFFFEKGVSLVIPEHAKPGIFTRMRLLVKGGSLSSMLLGTVALAIVANTYELLCTAGFPMVYTRALTLNKLSPAAYYSYLAFYNVVYIVPLGIIVAIFTITLGSRKLSEWQGRVLKLVSGTMMLSLGMVLLIKPVLLNNALASVLLLAGVLALSLAVVTATKRFFHPDE